MEIRVGEYKSISEVVYNDVRQEKDVIDENKKEENAWNIT